MKLKRLIKEFEAGDKLFADRGNNAGTTVRWKEWIEGMYAPDYEPNTEDEEKLLTLLSAYLQDPESGEGSALNLKELLPLKKKFPKVLDPTVATTAFQKAGTKAEDPVISAYNNHVWRGATIKASTLQELLHLGEWFGTTSHNWSAGFDNPRITYKSRGSYGFTSFSHSAGQASVFKGNYDRSRYSVIIGIKKSHPKLLFNAGFMNALSRFAEYESLFVGTSVKPDIIIINDNRLLKQMEADLKAQYSDDKERFFAAAEMGKFFTDWKRNAKLDPTFGYVG